MAKVLPNVLNEQVNFTRTMNLLKPATDPLGWKKSFLWLALSVACFHAAYTSIKYPAAGLFIFGYAFALVRLTDQPNVRRAFYFGLTTGFLCYAPQLYFFWKIFGPAAVVLWLILAFWIGLFTAIACGSIRRWGKVKAAWLIPVVWTGVEYFRSELYYLKFSWLNVGYALQFPVFGMYGCGFLVFSLIITFFFFGRKIVGHCIKIMTPFELVLLSVLVSILTAMFLPGSKNPVPKPILTLVGIQMEFPPAGILTKVLDQALAKNTNAPIFVLSEYTLDGVVPDALKDWCRTNRRFLVVGGKDFVTNDVYYNTAFVLGTNGDIVFQQAKSVPIQFVNDGLPAPEQKVWDSPWGKIGICICYDFELHARHRRTGAARRATAHRPDDGCGKLGPASA
jgi:apolipoprotein N-acyltransferase